MYKMLSCSCDYDYNYEPGDWYFDGPLAPEFITLNFKRRKRCCSCGKLISLKSLCLEHSRVRYPHSDTESWIVTGRHLDDSLDDEASIRIASYYQCEQCAEIYLNLTDIGYECLNPCDDMCEALKEYHDLTGFKKEVEE